MRVPFACNLRQGKADVISYSAAISACEKARRASVALEAWLLVDDVWEALEQLEVVPFRDTSKLISTSSKANSMAIGANLSKAIAAIPTTSGALGRNETCASTHWWHFLQRCFVTWPKYWECLLDVVWKVLKWHATHWMCCAASISNFTLYSALLANLM